MFLVIKLETMLQEINWLCVYKRKKTLIKTISTYIVYIKYSLISELLRNDQELSL